MPDRLQTILPMDHWLETREAVVVGALICDEIRVKTGGYTYPDLTLEIPPPTFVKQNVFGHTMVQDNCTTQLNCTSQHPRVCG